MITRFSVITGETKILLGIDKAEIFEAGIVYEVTKIMDEILLKPIGKYALDKKGYPSELSRNQDIIYSGKHLITEKELHKILNHEL